MREKLLRLPEEFLRWRKEKLCRECEPPTLDLALKILESSHSAWKWLFVVVMGFALREAIDRIVHYADPVTGKRLLIDWGNLDATEVALFAVFVIALARYFQGDVRYFDKTYVERPLREHAVEYRSIRTFCDLYLTLCHGVLFFALGVSVEDAAKFFVVYWSLLFINSVWLFMTYISAPNKDDVWANRIWAGNNMVFVGIFGVLYLARQPLGLMGWVGLSQWFVGLALLNAAIDYALTWQQYFPPLRQASDHGSR